MVRNARPPVRRRRSGSRGRDCSAGAGSPGGRRTSRAGAGCVAYQGAPLRPARLLYGWRRCRTTPPGRVTLGGRRGDVPSNHPRKAGGELGPPPPPPPPVGGGGLRGAGVLSLPLTPRGGGPRAGGGRGEGNKRRTPPPGRGEG